MGVITGEASGRLVAIDLDTAKSPKAAEWWHGLMVIENYGADIETWRARVRIRRRAHLFPLSRGLRHADRHNGDRR